MAMIGAMGPVWATVNVPDSIAPASWDGSEIVFSDGSGRIEFVAGGTVTGLNDAALDANSTDAATGRQVYAVDQKAENALTGLVALENSAVKFNAAKTEIDAQGAKVVGLRDGSVAADSKDAVTGSQLYTTNQDIGTINRRLTNLGLGNAGDDYTGLKYFRVLSSKDDAVAGGTDSVAVGPEASAAGASSIALGLGASTAGPRAVAVGEGASVASEYVEDAIALGTGATVDGEYSDKAMAIGADASASASGASALGAGALAAGANSVALGAARARGSSALALGNGAQANAANDIALGAGAGVNTFGSMAQDRTSHIAIGTRAGQDVAGNQTIALGFEAGSAVEGDHDIAIGSQAGTGLNGDLNVAIGYQANHAGGSIDRATAVGSQTYADRDSVALGYGAEASGEGAVALGGQARVTSGGGVAIGRNAVSDGASVALGVNSVASASDAVGLGYLTGSTFSGGVVSVGSSSDMRRIVNLADGSATYDAVNVGQLRQAQQSVANLVGGNVPLNADGSYGKIAVLDVNSDLHEYDTVVEALGAVTSGQIEVLPADAARYNADHTLEVAFATQAGEAVNLQQLNETIDANSSRYYSVNSDLPGNRSNGNATGINAMAIGPEAGATGDASMAIGYQALAEGEQAVALGYGASAMGANAIVVGHSLSAYGESSVTIGDNASNWGENAIVIGAGAQADNKDPNQTVDDSVVIGTEAESTADNGIAIGERALSSGQRGIAQGYAAQAVAEDATAIGSGAHAQDVNAIAIGTQAIASGVGAMAAGAEAHGYASRGIAMGDGAQAGKANPSPDELADNIDALAIGTSALADAKNASALGRDARATAEQALAVGDGSEVSGLQGSAFGAGNMVTAERGLALGVDSAVDGDDAQAVGNDNKVDADDAGVFGNRNSLGSKATGSRVIGNGNTVNVPDAFVIGNTSTVAVEGGVALGSGSASRTGANVKGYVPNSNGGTANNAIAATISTTGAVAVGANDVRRQITGVAAGTADTDAVNVAQLKATGWNVRTDGDKATHVSTGQGDTVDIGLADDENNLTVKRTSANGNTVIDYALKKNLDLGTAGSVKIGEVQVDSTGLSIATNGPSVTISGINAGGKTIVGVAEGISNTDAVNLGQLNAVKVVANTGWQLSVNGDARKDQSQVKPGAVVDFANRDDNVVIAKDGNNVKVDLNPDLKVDSVTAGTTVLDKIGLWIGDDVQLSALGLQMGSDVFIGRNGLFVGDVAITSTKGIDAGRLQISRVQAGVADLDAVNVSQLRDVQHDVDALGERAVKYDGNTGDPKNRVTLEGAVSTDGGKTGGTTLTNLARGEISATSTDAVNGAQLHEQGTQVAAALGGGSTYKDGKLVTELKVGDSSYDNVNDALNGVNDDLTVKITNVEEIANAGWQIQANGDDPGRVAPGGKVEFVNGDNVQITREISGDSDHTVRVSLAQNITLNSLTAVEVKADTVKTKEVAIEGGPTINQEGIDMSGNKIVNLRAGTVSTDAVNLGQLHAVTSGMQAQIDQVRGDVHDLDHKLSAGVAAAMATAGLPQAYLPGKSMAAVAGGTYNGESGFAVGLSRVSDSGSWVLKVSGNGNSRGDYGGAVGVGYQW